jgi:hypothetical protein
MHDKQVCMFVSCELPDAEGVRFSVLWVHLVHRVLLHRSVKWSAKWSVRPGQGFGKFDSTCFDHIDNWEHSGLLHPVMCLL